MIQAETIVHFYFNLDDVEDYKINIINYLNRLSGTLTTAEIIRIDTPFMSTSGLSSRVVARFKVLLDERPSCKHLDDYVSFIFPTVKNTIAGELISTQNLHLTYVRRKVEKKINWEELQHWSD